MDLLRSKESSKRKKKKKKNLLSGQHNKPHICPFKAFVFESEYKSSSESEKAVFEPIKGKKKNPLVLGGDFVCKMEIIVCFDAFE
jgi:hypothetical protein